MINEVIETLKAYTDGKDNAGKVEISVMQLNRIIKALEQQPTDAVDRVTIKEYLESFEVAQPKMGSSSENPNKWIPVSERLPKAGEYVGSIAKYYLVQNEYGDMLVARYTHSGYWEQIYHLKPYADEIVAWMPLPQKYKEEGWANE